MIGNHETREDYAQLERAHYQLQSSLYFTEVVDLEGAFVYFADGISEPEWNHAALLDTNSPSASAALLRNIETLFESYGLPPAVEVGPGCKAPNLLTLLSNRGFERKYRYAWLTPGNGVGPAGSIRNGIKIRTVDSAETMAAFMKVFHATYPDELDAGYERSLLRTQSTDCTVVHQVVLAEEKPVAIASSIHGQSGDTERITGLYNLAVHPTWRRLGLGRLLTRLRVEEAERRGHTAFLQTERRSVETWQRRHGLRLAFHTEGWVSRS